jgi:hypothetical protein
MISAHEQAMSRIDKMRQIRAKTYRVGSRDLTGAQILAVYEAIRDHPETHSHRSPRHVAIREAIGEGMGSGRVWDKTAQVLRRAGLIRYRRGPNPMWEAT